MLYFLVRKYTTTTTTSAPKPMMLNLLRNIPDVRGVLFESARILDNFIQRARDTNVKVNP